MSTTLIGTTTGTLNIQGDHDWIKTILSANTLYSITSDLTFDIPFGGTFSTGQLAVYDAEGNSVRKSDASGSALGFMPMTTSTYYIDISSSMSSGDYTLSLASSPDDFANNTTTLGRLAVGNTVSGLIDVQGDHDWFKTSLTQNTLYAITSNSNASLKIYDANGKSVGQSDASGSPLGFMPADSGIYYVDIHNASTAGNYTLSLATSPDDYANNKSTQGVIEVGGATSGNLNIKGDHDWIKASLIQNTLYAISSNSADAFLSVYDTSGNAVEQSDASGSALGFMPASSGNYFIDISNHSAQGSYTLNLVSSPDDYANNTSTAGIITVNGNAKGRFDVEGDHDWFKTTLDANVLYAITSDQANAFVTIYDATGKPVGKADAYGMALGFMPESSSSYYIDIGGVSTAGSYTLNLAQVNDDYANNTTTQGSVAVGNQVSGVFNIKGDHDWFKTTLIKNTLYAISSNVDGALFSVYDATGKLVGKADAFGISLGFMSDTAAGTGFMPASTGTYYIDISAYDTTGAYTLSLATFNDDYTDNVTTRGVLETGVIEAPNHAPTVLHTIANQTTAADSAFSFTVPEDIFSDADTGDTLSYQASLVDAAGAPIATGALPTWLAFDAATQRFTGTPSNNDTGLIDIKITATDSHGETAQDIFSLNVIPANLAPIANDVAVNGREDDHSVAIRFSATDDKGPIAYKVTSLPNHGHLYGDSALSIAVKTNTLLAGDTVYFVPDGNWNGDTNFNYQASDGLLDSASKTASIVIVAVNDSPSGRIDIIGNPVPGQTLTLSDTLNDADGLGDIRYQWLQNDQPINGANGNSYLVTSADAGRSLSVKASYIDGSGTSESITSNKALVLPDVTIVGTPVKGTLAGTIGNDVFDDSRVPATKNLSGGKGDDAYIIHNPATKIQEAAKQGVDIIYSNVGYVLPNNVEQLILMGGDNIDAKGNSADNLLLGNAGNNTLAGLAGNDMLTGGSGADRFVFDTTLNAKTNVDTITDFSSGEDKIVLKGTIFKKLGVSVEASEIWFMDSSAPQGQTGYLVYDTRNGVLAYDKDGNGKSTAIPIAIIGSQTHDDIQASDFVVI